MAARGVRLGRGRGGDRGVTMVEAAFALPVFFLFLFGIIEMAFFVNGNLTIAATTTDGARAAAIFGKDLTADFNIIQEVKARGDSGPRSSVVRLVVFHASGPADSVPAGCKSGTPSSGGLGGIGACNVYTPSLHFASANPADFNCSSTSPARFYCPSSRKVALASPPDYLGIYVLMDHRFLTGLFGSSTPLERTTIIRLEPVALNES